MDSSMSPDILEYQDLMRQEWFPYVKWNKEKKGFQLDILVIIFYLGAHSK